MSGKRVVIVHYRMWPGTGIKGVASTHELGMDMIRVLCKHWRAANADCAFDPNGFTLIEAEVDRLQLGGRTWAVGDGPPREVTGDVREAEAAPTLRPV